MKDEAKNIDDKPEKLIKAFADASVFASQGATQRAYGEYKVAAVTLGAMAGARFPGSPFGIADDIDKMGDTMEREGDIAAGLNLQMINAQIGFHAGMLPVLPDKLYLALRFGMFNTAVEQLDFKSFNIGLLGSYQILGGVKASGAFNWRGLTLTSGLVYQKTEMSYHHKMDRITQSYSASPFSGNLVFDPIL
ncbi:MAG: hypothetical protein LBN92_00395, partial [Treponema sp.]|nr:hypothetical protein [Treponema sp.]